MRIMMWSKRRFGSEYIVRFRVSKSVVGYFDQYARGCLGKNERERALFAAICKYIVALSHSAKQSRVNTYPPFQP